MIASNLYKRTLIGYESRLAKGESISLSKYCKAHRVNSRGLRYWMKKHSIALHRRPKSGKLHVSLRLDERSVPDTSGQFLIPLHMQTNHKGEISVEREKSFPEVNITLANGLSFCIKEIHPEDLVQLILSCNIR